MCVEVVKWGWRFALNMEEEMYRKKTLLIIIVTKNKYGKITNVKLYIKKNIK